MKKVYLILMLVATGGLCTLVMPISSAFSLDKPVVASGKGDRVYVSNSLINGGPSATTPSAGSPSSRPSSRPRVDPSLSHPVASGAPEPEAYMLLDEQPVSARSPKDANNSSFWPGGAGTHEGNASAPQFAGNPGAGSSALAPEAPGVGSGTQGTAPSGDLGNPNSLATLTPQGPSLGSIPSLSFPGASYGGGGGSSPKPETGLPSTGGTSPRPEVPASNGSQGTGSPASNTGGGGHQVPAGGGESGGGGVSPGPSTPELPVPPIVPLPQPNADPKLEPPFPAVPSLDYPGKDNGTTPPVSIIPVPDAGSSGLMLGSILAAFVLLRRRRS